MWSKGTNYQVENKCHKKVIQSMVAIINNTVLHI